MLLPFALDGWWLADSMVRLGKTAIFLYNTVKKDQE